MWLMYNVHVATARHNFYVDCYKIIPSVRDIIRNNNRSSYSTPPLRHYIQLEIALFYWFSNKFRTLFIGIYAKCVQKFQHLLKLYWPI